MNLLHECRSPAVVPWPIGLNNIHPLLFLTLAQCCFFFHVTSAKNCCKIVLNKYVRKQTKLDRPTYDIQAVWTETWLRLTFGLVSFGDSQTRLVRGSCNPARFGESPCTGPSSINQQTHSFGSFSPIISPGKSSNLHFTILWADGPTLIYTDSYIPSIIAICCDGIFGTDLASLGTNWCLSPTRSSNVRAPTSGQNELFSCEQTFQRTECPLWILFHLMLIFVKWGNITSSTLLSVEEYIQRLGRGESRLRKSPPRFSGSGS